MKHSVSLEIHKHNTNYQFCWYFIYNQCKLPGYLWKSLHATIYFDTMHCHFI